MKKKIIALIFLFLLTFPFALAEENMNFGEQINVRNEVVESHIKTRNEIKSYMDKKSDQLISEVTTKAQGFIDENFLVLDQRVHRMINAFLLKIVLGLTSCIVFSQLIWFFIKRKIEKIRQKKELIENDS